MNAVAGILDYVQTLITDAGDIIIPFTFVMLVDWLYVRRRRTPAAAAASQSPAAQ